MTDSSSYAVVRAKGKQVTVKIGDLITIDSISAEPGQEVVFEDILLVSQDGELTTGKPTVSGAAVAARVVHHKRSPKLVSFKKKRRKGYKRKVGHRQNLTLVRIESISC